ncbi:hypothetical protein HOG47_04240 [archaeon]|jgi:ABC-type dipeptide/oligopeptide/nickel transport system ATPase component|nr:hypothetical protein [archaeon]
MENNNINVLQQKQQELEKQQWKLKYIGERFINEGEERIVAKWQYLIGKGFLFPFLIMVLLTYLTILYLSFGVDINQRDINDFNRQLINNWREIPLFTLLILTTIIISIPTTIFIYLKKFVDDRIKKAKICHFAGIGKWRLMKINKPKKGIIKLTFKLKAKEKYDKEDIKNSLKELLIEFSMFDGVVIPSLSGKKDELELKMFNEKYLDFNNFKKIEDIDIKKKIIRVSGGINNFKIIEITDKSITFKNKELATFDKSELENAIPKLARLTGKHNGKLINNPKENDSYIIVFKNKVPTIETKLPLLDYKNVFEKNKLYLGVNDVAEKKYVKTIENEENRGKLNGHMLMVGASGSGKSYSVDIVMNNWIEENAYKDIEKIYILNFKDSADFNKYKKLDKVVYSDGNPRNALAMCKKVELEMTKRYIYNSINNKSNYPGQKILFIIDEIQTISEEMNSRSQEAIVRNSWMEINRILTKLGSKSRAANISLFVALQKGTAENLPGGMTFRDNLRHRFALKNSNMSLLLDQELIDKENIESDKLEQGQFVYMDNLKGEASISEGFCQGIDLQWESDLPVKENDSDEDKLIIKDLEKYEEVSQIVFDLEAEQIEKEKEEGKKTYVDTISDLNNFKEILYVDEAIKIWEQQRENNEDEEEWEAIDLDSEINFIKDEYDVKDLKNDKNVLKNIDINIKTNDKTEEIDLENKEYVENSYLYQDYKETLDIKKELVIRTIIDTEIVEDELIEQFDRDTKLLELMKSNGTYKEYSQKRIGH